MKTITTRFYGPTNTRGARITATDNDGHRATVPYDYSLSHAGPHDLAVIALCKKMRWTGVLVRGCYPRGHVYVWQCSDTITVSL